MPASRQPPLTGYPQRSDIAAQPAKAATGQPYGQAGQQLAAQQAQPLPAQGPVPGSMGALDRDTERPGEPITAGMGMGAGPGPEALTQFPQMTNPEDAELLGELREAYKRFPSEELRQLIEIAESG